MCTARTRRRFSVSAAGARPKVSSLRPGSLLSSRWQISPHLSSPSGLAYSAEATAKSFSHVTAREAEYIMGNAYTRPQTHMHQDSDAANAQLQISEEAGMLYDPTAKHMAVTTAATCCYPDKEPGCLQACMLVHRSVLGY